MSTLKKPILTQDLTSDIRNYLGSEFEHVAVHSIEVADCAAALVERFGGDREAAKQAGLLHDISVVVPNEEKILLAQQLGIDICEEERQVPMLSHQKLSRYMAKELFRIEDSSVLSAIECHTTLKRNPSKMDQLVFLADKIKWDQGGEPPYLTKLESALNHSLEEASLVYIDYLLSNDILVIHPWLAQARTALIQQRRS
ncbi:bis(5'-nucleosyl)-tetraphosphatase (symmetrical) YqeK [Enterococcus sp. BWM-S5]|uniref:bis(5'-nucleosyl)-tetraphosphatase (symmetrical) n=1 Tax=Enterococcus larvae TaxID=2794352 RepID=A0ABS4CQR0_9ENTE|nr:bis(5'-nucleosyl)-tetraphosphatase (symmetrical) YqeK [Enterococcus larvae]MBP1048352.1 bis(5'-nucleosyl)-tetraphosphatase (symmetrical) YqeK [Enterococcus larvae]